MKLEDLHVIRITTRDKVKIFFCRRVDEYYSFGSFHPSTFEIKIDDTKPTSRKARTLLHELTHALDSVYDIQLTEAQTEKLEEGYVRLFALNPGLKNLLFPI